MYYVVCVCVCVCKERERQRLKKIQKEIDYKELAHSYNR